MTFRYRPYSMHISLLSKKYDQKVCEILGSYYIDPFVMLKSVTNKNFSNSTCLNFENFV